MTETKTVNRIIRLHLPNGTTSQVTQSVTFTRSGVVENQPLARSISGQTGLQASGSTFVDWSAWIPEGNGMFAAFTAPEIPGYTAVPASIVAAMALPDDSTVYADIRYVANSQSLSGSTSMSTSMGSQSLSGSTMNSLSPTNQTTSDGSLSGRQPASSVKGHLLPQTGANSRPATAMGVVTGLVASLGALFGISKKKRQDD